MDCDGTKDGYDVQLTRAAAESVKIPVIASGGAGKLEHFHAALTSGGASAVLAASLFHFGELSIAQVKASISAARRRSEMNIELDKLKYDEHGLLPAIVQDADSREVLTLAYMNAESLARTIETKETWFWSRSRNELWHKGATSGNTQQVVDLIHDCDNDALVVLVKPAGPACHTGARFCFGDSEVAASNLGVLLDQLYELVQGAG